MRTFLVLCKKRKYFTQPAPPQKYCCYIASSIQKITRFNSMVEDLRKKFSLHANISCVKQKSKLFHQAPPLTLVLLYCKFLTEIHAVQFDSGIFKEEILFRCKNFLCYARNKNISPRPPPQLEAVKKKFSLDVKISCVMQETKIFHQGPPLNWKI